MGLIMLPKAVALAVLVLFSAGVAKRVLHQDVGASASQQHAELIAKDAEAKNAEALLEQEELATSETAKDAGGMNIEASEAQSELSTTEVSQEQIELATKEAESMMADADFRKRLQEIEEEVSTDPEARKELEAYAEQLSADPSLQKQVASMQEQLKTMNAKQPSAQSLLEDSGTEDSGIDSSMWQRFAMLMLASEDTA